MSNKLKVLYEGFKTSDTVDMLNKHINIGFMNGVIKDKNLVEYLNNNKLLFKEIKILIMKHIYKETKGKSDE